MYTENFAGLNALKPITAAITSVFNLKEAAVRRILSQTPPQWINGKPAIYSIPALAAGLNYLDTMHDQYGIPLPADLEQLLRPGVQASNTTLATATQAIAAANAAVAAKAPDAAVKTAVAVAAAQTAVQAQTAAGVNPSPELLKTAQGTLALSAAANTALTQTAMTLTQQAAQAITAANAAITANSPNARTLIASAVSAAQAAVAADQAAGVTVPADLLQTAQVVMSVPSVSPATSPTYYTPPVTGDTVSMAAPFSFSTGSTDTAFTTNADPLATYLQSQGTAPTVDASGNPLASAAPTGFSFAHLLMLGTGLYSIFGS